MLKVKTNFNAYKDLFNKVIYCQRTNFYKNFAVLKMCVCSIKIN